MLNCPTFSVSVGIPIFGLGFTSTNHLIIGGGGGGGRSGVKNKLSAYRIDGKRRDLEEEAVYEVPEGEDAPMCLAVHPTDHSVVAGINASKKEIEAGVNKHCRVFRVTEENFTLHNAVQISTSKKEEEYQKVVRFSEDGSLVAVGTSDGHAEVFKYPSFESNGPTIKFDDEVLDVDIGLENDKLTCVTRDAIKLVTIRGKNSGKILQTLPVSAINKKRRLQFRSFRYGRGAVKDVGFAVVNGVDKPAGYVVRLNPYTFETIKVHQVSKKPITAMCTSFDGAILAIASSDLSITLFDASSMQILTHIKNAHNFSITSMAISTDRRTLASGSADNTCRIIFLPLQFPPISVNPFHTLFLALAIAGTLLWLTTMFNAGDLDESFAQERTVSSRPVKVVATTKIPLSNVIVPVSSPTTEFVPIETIESSTFVSQSTEARDEL